MISQILGPPSAGMSRSQRQLVWSVSMQMLDSVLEPRSAAYVSGPLQTGRLYYEAQVGHFPVDVDVRTLNEQRLSRVARQVRARLPYPVIDPGLLVVDGWRGSDYVALYIEILRRYAKEVWFVDGWHYSSGATTEYTAAVAEGIPCLDERGRPLVATHARALIAEAADHVGRLGLDASELLTHVA